LTALHFLTLNFHLLTTTHCTQHPLTITNRYRTCTILCSVDRASLYNLVNKANLVYNLLLVNLSISTCFRRLCAHHQEKQLCLCDTWYLLFCMDGCLVCRVDDCLVCRVEVSHKHSCFS